MVIGAFKMESKAFVVLFFITNLLATASSQGGSFDCAQCARDPSACRRISGLYTVTVLTKGTYNPVVVIPAPACSINITELRSSRNYIAVKTANNVGIINSYWALGQPGQYYGAGTRFSYDQKSDSCPGSCIRADGPILNEVVVQLLYNDINPGIAYEFVLPKHVQFNPSHFTGSKREESKPSYQTTTKRPEGRIRRLRLRHRSSSRSQGTSEVKGEYYPGSVGIRSEGRPEETAEATGPVTSPKRVIANQRSSDNKRISYGSHTLGGKGLSYTAYTSRRRGQGDKTRSTSGRSGRRYSRQNPRLIKKISSPTYSAPSSPYRSRTSEYPRQSQYQSLSAKTGYSGSPKRGSKYLRAYDTRKSPSRSSTAITRYRWKISGLTECSRPCGGGVQKTNVVCISIGSRTQVVVTPENCGNLYRPRVQTVECNTSPCEAAWQAEAWSECSVTCGYGTQTRQIECRRRFSPTLILRVSADQCGLDNKPAVAQQCEEGLCATWHSGQWTRCSKDCGGGEKQREVRCLDSFNSPLPSNYCVEARPRDREACNSLACQVQWWLSDWPSECSETCGRGYQFRKALCLDDNGQVTTESSCDTKRLPDLRRFCDSDSSCVGTWITSSWGKCSARCGRGKRKRTVACMHLTSTSMLNTPEEDCNTHLKPPSEEACMEADCPSVWYTSTWSQCSVTCGRGYKTRDVKCLDDKNQASVACHPSLKPETRELCTLDSCNLYQDGQDASDEIEESLDSGLYERRPEYAVEKFEGSEEEEDISEEIGEEIGEEISADFESTEENNPELDAGRFRPSPDRSSSSTGFGLETSDDECKDTFYNCLMVIQSRLCPYEFYRKRCCQSCRKSYGR